MGNRFAFALGRELFPVHPDACALFRMLSPVFEALYHIPVPGETTFSERIELATAAEHLQVLTSGVKGYESVCNLFGVVFGAMAADARNWYETGEHPGADTWYLPRLRWMMHRYKHCVSARRPQLRPRHAAVPRSVSAAGPSRSRLP